MGLICFVVYSNYFLQTKWAAKPIIAIHVFDFYLSPSFSLSPLSYHSFRNRVSIEYSTCWPTWEICSYCRRTALQFAFGIRFWFLVDHASHSNILREFIIDYVLPVDYVLDNPYSKFKENPTFVLNETELLHFAKGIYCQLPVGIDFLKKETCFSARKCSSNNKLLSEILVTFSA